VTPDALLQRELRRDGSRPLITWYDGDTGARVELSVTTTANWAAKIAGHLVDDYDAEPGLVVRPPTALHWVTAVVLLGVWTAGAAVTFGADADVELEVEPDPMGAALSRLVGAQPDDFMPVMPVAEYALALRLGGHEWTHQQLAEAAAHGARSHRLESGARVLSTLPLDDVDGLDAGLLVPLEAGGSVVLVAHADADRLATTAADEKVTHVAGVDLPGLPRLA
jgi:hypothetical protein